MNNRVNNENNDNYMSKDNYVRDKVKQSIENVNSGGKVYSSKQVRQRFGLTK